MVLIIRKSALNGHVYTTNYWQNYSREMEPLLEWGQLLFIN